MTLSYYAKMLDRFGWGWTGISVPDDDTIYTQGIGAEGFEIGAELDEDNWDYGTYSMDPYSCSDYAFSDRCYGNTPAPTPGS